MSEPATSPRIRVLCADDHRIVREGLALIIGRQPDMEVVGLAATGDEAVQLFDQEQPDVTVMDLHLGTVGGLQAIQLIRRKSHNARIIVLTGSRGDEDMHRALKAGAATYLLKDTSADDLIRIVREVHAGGSPLGAQVKARLDERASHPTLTPREIEVLEHVSRGRRNREIATRLKITEDTVTVHMRNIFAKLGVSDRVSALNVAIRRGIVHLD